MILTAKLRNNSTPWSANLRPRVSDVVSNGGVYYANVAGYNGTITDTAIWFPIGAQTPGSSVPEFDYVAGDITGTDPFWALNLSADGLPAFPTIFAVYQDLPGTGAWLPISPVQYDPVAQVLSGMSSPTDFPSQKIKIFAS